MDTRSCLNYPEKQHHPSSSDGVSPLIKALKLRSHLRCLQGAPHIQHQVAREAGRLPEALSGVHTQGILGRCGQEKIDSRLKICDHFEAMYELR